MSQRAQHPYIGFLVRNLNDVELLLESDNAGLALDRMYDLLHSVELKARQNKSWGHIDTYLEDTIRKRRSVRNNDERVLLTMQSKFDHESYWEYKKLKSAIWLIMWESGYMNENTFMGIIPASTLKKQKDTPSQTPFVERLPDELR